MNAAEADTLRARLAALAGEAAVATIALPGLGELPLASPADEPALLELLRFAARERLAVLPCGLGSKLGWTRAPERASFSLSTRALRGVVAYEPGDGTLTARAGSTIAELASVVRAGGHHLTPDVPRAHRATIGGAVSAGESGVDRLRCGPLRHHVLGLRVALADGTVAKSGGRLVKNVTGFDLHRLYTGSHGSLCVVLEASLRLFPLAEEDAWLILPAASADAAFALARAALALDARPWTLVLARAEAPAKTAHWALLAHLRGLAEVVAAEKAAFAALEPRAHVLSGGEARDAAADLREKRFAAADDPWLRIACRPSRLAAAHAAVERALATLGWRSRVLLEPAFASLEVALPGARGDRAPAPEALAALVRSLRADLSPLAATVELREGGAAMGLVDPFGEPDATLGPMRRLRSAFDRAGQLAHGRFHGGL